MSENDETTTPPAGETAQVATPPAPTGAADQGTDSGGSGLDTEALQKALAETRAEAARNRVRAREAEAKAAEAKSAEEFNAVNSRVAELEADLSRERLARQYGLPDQLATRIAGTTPEEMEADAKSLSALVRSPGVGRGGLTPSAGGTPLSPSELAKRIPRGRS